MRVSIIKGALVGLATALTAQAAWAADETPAASGPPVAGVCILSQQTLISRSKVGIAASGRLHDLAQASQTEFDTEKSGLESRGKALAAKRTTLPPAQLQAQGMALNQRVQGLQRQAAIRQRQLEDTRAKAINRVVEVAQPFITQALTTHGCGLLIAREAILGGNLTNDLTTEILAAMDAKATPISITLEPASR